MTNELLDGARLDERQGIPPHCADRCRLRWWRWRRSKDVGPTELRALRETLRTIVRSDERSWSDALAGDAAAAVRLALLNERRTDAVMSALLFCATLGDPAANFVLRRAVARIDGHRDNI